MYQLLNRFRIYRSPSHTQHMSISVFYALRFSSQTKRQFKCCKFAICISAKYSLFYGRSNKKMGEETSATKKEAQTRTNFISNCTMPWFLFFSLSFCFFFHRSMMILFTRMRIIRFRKIYHNLQLHCSRSLAPAFICVCVLLHIKIFILSYKKNSDYFFILFCSCKESASAF